MVSSKSGRGLPYGYWFQASTQTEALFDRDFSIIAHRSFWAGMGGPATFGRHTPDNGDTKYDFTGFFYDDECPPWHDPMGERFCYEVLGRFMLRKNVSSLLYHCPEYKFPGRPVFAHRKARKRGLKGARDHYRASQLARD